MLGYSTSYGPNEDRMLQLTTDKSEYGRGETVIFNATNLGSETLIFPNSALGLSITNTDTGQSYGMIALQVLTPIDSGQSRQVTWTQIEGEEAAEEGHYLASIRTAAGSPTATAEASFTID